MPIRPPGSSSYSPLGDLKADNFIREKNDYINSGDENDDEPPPLYSGLSLQLLSSSIPLAPKPLKTRSRCSNVTKVCDFPSASTSNTAYEPHRASSRSAPTAESDVADDDNHHYYDHPGSRHRRYRIPTIQITTYQTILTAILPATSSLLQLSLLLYFVLSYLHLQRSDPPYYSLPRVPGLYSTYPFISCLGSQHLTTYRTISILTSTFSVISSISTYILTPSTPIRKIACTRILTLISILVSSSLNIALSIAAARVEAHLHLGLLALHSAASFLSRAGVLLVDRALRAANPTLVADPTAREILCWKEGVAAVALPLAILLNLGVYTCNVPTMDLSIVVRPGTRCYRVLGVAAPADWAYAVSSVIWALVAAWEAWWEGRQGGFGMMAMIAGVEDDMRSQGVVDSVVSRRLRCEGREEVFEDDNADDWEEQEAYASEMEQYLGEMNKEKKQAVSGAVPS